MHDLDIIIPVYNEKENILAVLEGLRKSVKTSLRVLICYDHDNDNTLPPVRNYKGANFEIALIKNQGKGVHSAIMTGFRASNAAAVLVYSADDDYNIVKIDQMYEKFKQGCELVAASRFVKGGCMKGCPWLKSFLVQTASFTLYWFASIPIRDASNGFRLFSRRVIDNIVIESTQGFTYSLELLVKCHRLGWKLGEVPVSWFERTKGKSRFRVIQWLPRYLRWYFYGIATTYLRQLPSSVKIRENGKAPQNKDAELCFFNRFGNGSNYDVFTEKGYQRIIDEFLKYFIPKKDLKVIDFGCGTGSFIAKFLKYGMKLYAIDISSNCISYAKSKYPDIFFNVGDIEATQFPDETFDIIFLSGVLHHFADFSNVLNECYRVLRRGGVVLGYDPHKLNPFMWLYRSKNSPFYSLKGVTENERTLGKSEIRVNIKFSGFSEYNVYSISGVAYKYVDHKLSFLIIPLYNLFEKLMDFPLLRQWLGSFIITYAKK
ncbi:MAG: methyltransferase domain-containing protein [Candidatus Omnitrophica bacterium]|nr:methyltransferase domain-containing protein [Candidatus Omnitrophota bacterium]